MLLQFLLVAQSQRNLGTLENAQLLLLLSLSFCLYCNSLSSSMSIVTCILQMLQFYDESTCRHRISLERQLHSY